MNEELQAAYRDFMPAFRAALEANNADFANLSAPLLLKVFPDYDLAKNKLFVVGQETNWWGEPDFGGKEYSQHSVDTISLLTKCYEQFAMGSPKGKTYSSPIWHFMPALYKLLNPGATTATGFLWSNLYRTDQRGKRPGEAVRGALRNCQPEHILAQEIRIAKPDTVVFVTGRPLDWEIKNVFPGATFQSLDGSFLAKVIHPHLPPNRTFRTYHPSYLQRKGRVNSMAKQIAELVER